MKKYLPILVLLIGLGVFIATATTPAFAVTIEEFEELQKQIQKLLEAIRSLQSQVPTPPPSNTCPFVSVMYLGYSETPTNEVRELQKLLKQYPNIYPEGMVTGYFGKLTDAALRRFQQQYGLPTTGQTDTATRAKLCELWQNKNQIGNCGWCGTACVRQIPNMYCPQVMPPIGVSCQEVNGVCQITPLIPITTTTIPPVPTTIVPSCTDSDGGMNIYVKGHTIGYNPQAAVGYRNVDIWDKCYTERSVYEYGCRDGYFASGLYDCPTGYTCQDGACKPATNASITIISPNGGEKFSTGQTIPISFVTTLTDKQTSGITLQLYKKTTDSFGKMYIQDIVRNWIYGSPYQWTIPNTIAPGEYFIYATVENLNNVSVKEVYDFSDAPFSIVSNTSCTDSDGGNNIYIKGTTTGPDAYGGNTSRIATYTDSCDGTSRVLEFYCNTTNSNSPYVTATNIPCPTGTTCQDGACKPATNASITIISPNGGEKLEIGKQTEIRWSTIGFSNTDPVQIGIYNVNYDSEGGPCGEFTIANTLNTGKYLWTPQLWGQCPTGSGYKI